MEIDIKPLVFVFLGYFLLELIFLRSLSKLFKKKDEGKPKPPPSRRVFRIVIRLILFILILLALLAPYFLIGRDFDFSELPF